ncbi:hypothetical protein CCR97_26965 [Rhodoplanes elegans]|uniref:Lipoprotein n=1 Tax=Rhodoplanes elegans TaxID=29408 RepID=A0A327K1A9_9BRAD|nr:hypothetical protein [Rhodoplanes elegans]MBK5961822.1 hypothetical protein [Rhodoplanes elegans]RAI31664.1 hypothetical protein CH338_25465 [Rhodoplanes elegans]
MRFSRSRRGLAATLGAAAVLLGACTSMPVTSMVKLARTDFATIDPAVLRVAVRLPAGVRPRPGSVTLKLTVTVGAAAPVVSAFVLADLADPAELASLRGEVTKGAAVWAYRLEPADVARVTALRSELMARKGRGERGSLSLGVGAEACRTAAAPERVLLTTYLKTEAGGDFFPLVRDVDLRDVPGAGELPSCG